MGRAENHRRRGALVVALAASALALGCGGDDDSAGPGAPDSTRVATVRIYQHNDWTIPGETPASVAKALASLKPTWVSSLIRYDEGEEPRAEEIAAWNEIRDTVRKASPNAQFGIELNAEEYETAEDVEQMMSSIRPKFDNDGWFFDFFTPAYRERPEVVEAAVAAAHGNDEWVGGNAFGLSSDPPIPPGSDFIAVQDFDFEIDLQAVRELAKKLPVVFHLGNSPALAKSDGCEFINEFETDQRRAYVNRRAKQQQANDFRFGYPVFFPECARNPNNPSSIYTFNAPRDSPMMPTITSLIRRYND